MTFLNWIGVVAGSLFIVFIVLFASHPFKPASTPTAQSGGAHVVANASSPFFSPFGSLFQGLFPSIIPSVPSSGSISSTTTTSATTTVATTTTNVRSVAATSTAMIPAVADPTAAARAAAVARLNATVGLAQGAVVNILCISDTNALKSASASGIIVDPRGIILTVAHMAQYFLLENYPQNDDVRCVIRTGSPAHTAYFASPIYISPSWIAENPSTLTAAEAKGTGQDDFALLAITSSANDTPLPASFPYIPLSSKTPQLGDPVTIGSYGAEFLTTNEVKSALYPIIVFGSISDRFTFAKTSVDLISVSNSAAAQEGSSGGAVINADNQLTGLITTSSLDSSFSLRTLHAITPLHIRSSFMADTGADLGAYISSHALPDMIAGFSGEAKILSKKLESNL